MAILKHVRQIAVIGAGPSGLAAAKYEPIVSYIYFQPLVDQHPRYLLAEKHFDKIDVFEQRSSVGGTWNYCPAPFKQRASVPVPHTSPHEPVEEPKWKPTGDNEGTQEPAFVSPIYRTLDTNLPKELMRYSDKEFPADVQALPHHPTVKKYLEEYGDDVKGHVRFETQVLDVRLKPSGSNTWDLVTRNLRTGAKRTDAYDAVVVASGHFDVPYVPSIAGISDWNKAYPGVVSHSKVFDSPDPFHGKKVVVVGSSASAIDIGSQISQVSRGKLLVSQRTESYLLPSTDADKVYFPEIVEFLPPNQHERAVRFADGRVEEKIDSIVFCTGYFYSFPFLPSLDPPVITDGRRVRNVYEHLFYIDNPTLVFPVLTQRVIPFPMSENQASVYARVWSGRLELPDRDRMKAWEDSLVAEKGEGTAFHLLPFPQDANHLNMLYDWAAHATTRGGLANDGKGKQGTYWGEREKWLRSLFPEIRRRFVGKGPERHKITSLVELGYDFDRWKQEQEGSRL